MNFVMIYGPTAAGKLTVGQQLAAQTGYKLLDNHSVFSALTPLFPFEDPALDPIRSSLGKKFRLEIFEEAAKAGVDFIATMIIRNPESIEFLRDAISLVKRHRGHVYLIQLLPTTEALMHRVEQPSRKHSGKVATRDLLAKRFAEQPMRFRKFPDFDHLTIDNSNLNPSDCADIIVQHYGLHLSTNPKPTNR